MHFWAGSLCYIQKGEKAHFPPKVIAISDIIAILDDFGNRIPDKSWMLYLLELFNKQGIPIELNLICSFNDDGKFHAIFGGKNQYEFKTIKPQIGNSYLRQIIMNQDSKTVNYFLKDINAGKSESFILSIKDEKFIFEGINCFTGIEWHNKINNIPYEIRYHVKISELLYGINDDPRDFESIAFFPYNRFIPNKDGKANQFPISFIPELVEDLALCYKVSAGTCENGLNYSLK